MTMVELALIAGGALIVVGGFGLVIRSVNRLKSSQAKQQKSKEELDKAYNEIAEEDVAHLFNKEFREELRNQGRIRFEKIIDENAMFLKQDLDMTISQLNDYMKKEISTKLDAEFADYSKAMKEAQELALATLKKTTEEVEAQRVSLAEALKQQVSAREEALMKAYEANMAKVVEHYVLQALGDQFDLKSQLPYIIKQLEAEKQHIAEDMRL